MPSLASSRLGRAGAVAVLCLCLGLWAAPAAALDLFARHQVSVQFATADGKPMANADVRVFAPGQPNRPALTGRTDSEGKFDFAANEDGMWSAEARTAGEIAHATVRVGSPGAGGGGAERQEPPSPYWVFAALGLLLVLAFGFRILRARNRRQPKL